MPVKIGKKYIEGDSVNPSEQKIRQLLNHYNNSNLYSARILPMSNTGRYPSYLFTLNPKGSAWLISFFGNKKWRDEM